MMNEFYHKFYSQYLDRQFEILSFGEEGQPLIIFPPAKGRYWDAKDNGMIQSLAPLLESKKLKIYCPDLLDQEIWFDNELTPKDKIQSYLRFEEAILKDVIEFAKYETGFDQVWLCGCELGAYYAANIAFKYQEHVSALFALSGRFGIKDYLGDFYNEDVYFNSPKDYLSNCEDPWKYNHIQVTLCTGLNDKSFDDNNDFNWILNVKGIPHKF
ncbi:MAG: esterase, partial [Ignavibacteria bacterium]